MTRYIHHDYVLHEYYGGPGFGIWHLVGIILGIIILLALIGLCLSCMRGGTGFGYGGAPGAVVY